MPVGTVAQLLGWRGPLVQPLLLPSVLPAVFPLRMMRSGGIACDECNEWCHGSQTCTGFPSVFVKEVLKHQGKGVKYVCTRCRLASPVNSSSPANPDLQLLREFLSQMFNTIAGLSNSVKSIDLRISETQRDSVVSGGEGRTDRSDVRTIIREKVRVLSEREKRQDSIIIRSLPFGENFQEKFNPIASFLLPERSDPITLVDIVPVSPSLVRAKIPNSNLKQESLSRSNKLFNSQYAQVFISRDFRERNCRERGLPVILTLVLWQFKKPDQVVVLLRLLCPLSLTPLSVLVLLAPQKTIIRPLQFQTYCC
ncbi:uncharacterized protein LOC126999210 [Eriocheir sinensis]|uniref:uncharacterized protein LOC126999210 n=1 Tax=Eriocheir sinensis TaxID=95602 RepID=UPI0021C7BB49|nr:uncharacterized protein LOC126999210 [Eriocheir sinensis]